MGRIGEDEGRALGILPRPPIRAGEEERQPLGPANRAEDALLLCNRQHRSRLSRLGRSADSSGNADSLFVAAHYHSLLAKKMSPIFLNGSVGALRHCSCAWRRWQPAKEVIHVDPPLDRTAAAAGRADSLDRVGITGRRRSPVDHDPHRPTPPHSASGGANPEIGAVRRPRRSAAVRMSKTRPMANRPASPSGSVPRRVITA
jgi:hypothetical protein